MNQEAIVPRVWRDRCARRIVELDAQLTEAEARDIAADFQAFERTRVMAPEAAADFVIAEMNRTDPTRFERRSRARTAAEPLPR